MATVDVLGTVSDRLVGGMMFHSDHADMCRWLGVPWLARLHEDGYEHDASCLRRVHRCSIDVCGIMVPDGRQTRSHDLDAYRQQRRWDVRPDVRCSAIKDTMVAWVEWEAGTVTVLTSAHRRLFDGGEATLAHKVDSIARDTEEELAHARYLLGEMEAVSWDMSHIMEMG